VSARPKDGARSIVATARGTRSQRRSDIRLIAFAAFLVLVAGGLIAVGLLTAMGSSDAPTCGRLPLGSAESLRTELQNGPLIRSGGGQCAFYLALDGGDFVAYRQRDPDRDCTVHFRDDRYWCDDEPVASADLATYPTTIESVDGVDTVVVDLRARAGA
jgi:hypothetical protein